jgi:hypothetical protein
MTQNTSTNPSSAAPVTPAEETVTDYLIRKFNGKKDKAAATAAHVSLDKTAASSAKVKKSVDLADIMVNVIIVMMLLGITAATAIAIIGYLN